MSFQIHALPATRFKRLFAMSDGELASIKATRMVADAKPGYPCRISLVDAVPEALKIRLISIRAFDNRHYMIAADVVDGDRLAEAIPAMFDDPAVDYLHLHNARPGCFAARVTRA